MLHDKNSEKNIYLDVYNNNFCAIYRESKQFFSPFKVFDWQKITLCPTIFVRFSEQHTKMKTFFFLYNLKQSNMK